MFRGLTLPAAVLALLFAPTGTAASELMEVGPQPDIYPTNVNNAGQVSASVPIGDPMGPYKAVRWERGTVVPVAGGTQSAGRAISGMGTIFGEGYSDPFTNFPAYWDTSGQHGFPNEQPGEGAGFQSASDSGTATVITYTTDGKAHPALARPPAYAYEPIPVGDAGQPMSVNDMGHVAGKDATNKPFLWTGGDTVTPIEIVPADPHAINARDDIAGRIAAPDPAAGSPGVRTGAGVVVALPALPEATPAQMTAKAIADSGIVVGNASYGSEPVRDGVFWRDGAVARIDTLLPPGSPWHVTGATDVSPNGEWMLLTGRQAGATTDSGLVLGTPCSAGKAISVPGPTRHDGPSGWSLTAAISPNDGLVLTDVRLGERYLAARISLPSWSYVFTSAGSRAVGRSELVADGSQPTALSRLVKFEVANTPGALRLIARYEIEKLPGGACMAITQDYTFKASAPGDHCEPAGKLPCARFVPKAAYEFLRAPTGVERLDIALPQRFGFVDDAAAFNAAALMLDQDSVLPSAAAAAVKDGVAPLSAPIIRDAENPVVQERAADVIRGGVASVGPHGWDNYHQTSWQSVEPPKALDPSKVFGNAPFSEWVAIPGCPECVHIHWRWGVPSALAPGFADHHGGKVAVPAGSDQDVTVGIVRVPGAGAEEDPLDWRALLGDEALGSTPRAPRELPSPGKRAQIAFWYEGVGHRTSESFFEHGGFFAVDVFGPPKLLEVRLKPTTFTVVLVKGKGSAKKQTTTTKRGPAAGATLRFRLSEWGAALVATERRAAGRRLKGRCVAPGKKAGKRENPCVRWIPLDVDEVDGGTDRTTLALTGRIAGKTLRPGRYRLSVRARDLSGELSKAKTIAFTIVAKRR